MRFDITASIGKTGKNMKMLYAFVLVTASAKIRTGAVLSLLLLLLTTAVFAGEGSATKNAPIFQRPVRLAFICFLKGEQTSGLNKICFYDCPTGGAAITVKGYELCPLTTEH